MNWLPVSRWILAMGMISMGVLHLVKPQPFVRAVPAYLPWAGALVLVSGFCEAAGGFGLLVPNLRMAAAYGLIALFIAVFPANVNMAIHWSDWVSPGGRWLLFLRLPLQLGLIYWAFQVRK